MHNLPAFIQPWGITGENNTAFQLIRDQFTLAKLSNASTFRLTGIGHAAVETGETIRSIHCPVVSITPQGRDAGVDLPDWHTGLPTDMFSARFALPLRNHQFLLYKGSEMHAVEAFIILVALSYRATWDECIHILNGILYLNYGAVPRGGVGPVPVSFNYHQDLRRWLIGLKDQYGEMLLYGRAEQWDTTRKLVGISTYDATAGVWNRTGFTFANLYARLRQRDGFNLGPWCLPSVNGFFATQEAQEAGSHGLRWAAFASLLCTLNRAHMIKLYTWPNSIEVSRSRTRATWRVSAC